MAKHPQSVDSKTLSRIYGKGRGWVFTPSHFLDLGTRKSISMALSQNTVNGTNEGTYL